MKFNSLVILGVVATASLVSVKQVTAYQTNAPIPVAQTAITQVAAAVGQSGNFQAGEHPTRGGVSIVSKNKKIYLQFDQNFKTNNGPDVYVILYRSSKPPVYGLKGGNYALIARLKKFSGSQSYVLPANIKLSEYKSVAVWCRKFNAMFGYAPIGG